MANKLDRLLFLQGGDCFFCKKPLRKEDASVEHLVPQCAEGESTIHNCVACCKAINSIFGNLPLKEKIGALLAQKGRLQCPNGH